MASMSDKDRRALNVTKTFINTKRVNSAKFGNEAHFMSFAAIIATRNGTEGPNFHIRNTMTAIVARYLVTFNPHLSLSDTLAIDSPSFLFFTPFSPVSHCL